MRRLETVSSVPKEEEWVSRFSVKLSYGSGNKQISILRNLCLVTNPSLVKQINVKESIPSYFQTLSW